MKAVIPILLIAIIVIVAMGIYIRQLRKELRGVKDPLVFLKFVGAVTSSCYVVLWTRVGRVRLHGASRPWWRGLKGLAARPAWTSLAAD